MFYGARTWDKIATVCAGDKCPNMQRRVSPHKMTEVHLTSHTRVAHHPYHRPSNYEYAIREYLYPGAVAGHVTNKAMQVDPLLVMGALVDNL